MPRRSALRVKSKVLPMLIGCAFAGLAHGATAPSNLLSLLEGAADGSWVKASLNTFISAAPDISLRNQGFGYDAPAAVLTAWSSVAWDSKRGDLLAWGGGHANYGGNEMYRWNGSTQLWELASLPSKLTKIPTSNLGGDLYVAVDGVFNAPTAAHTYDNNEYLPIADRFITLGGAAFSIGSQQHEPLPNGGFKPTGPYLFDPSKADGSKVGGITGSGVNPLTPGGSMWQNRDERASLFTVSTWRGTLPVTPVDGTSAVAVENGHDVMYFSGGALPWNVLMRYEIVDVSQPSLDKVSVVGSTSALTPYGAAGLDTERGFYVTLSLDNSNPFVAWDINQTGGFGNEAVKLKVVGDAGFDGAYIGGIDWDKSSGDFFIWTGASQVWRLEAPDSGLITDNWLLTLENDGSQLGLAGAPDGMTNSGVRGKWKYADGLNAFVAVEGNASGDVWLYRPANWSVTAVPEPGTWPLWLAGLAGLASLKRRRTAA